MAQRKPLLSFIAALLCATLSFAGARLWAAEDTSGSGDRSWEESMAAFAAADLQAAPSSGGIVFVGSSSIRLWRDLEKQWEAARVINRGFGGARLSDCTRYLDRLVLPHAPRLIVVYAGDNDLAEGRRPKEVFNEFVRFVGAVRNALPSTRIAYISIKPSPSRARLIPQVREANQLIEKFTSLGENLEFVDVFTPMLDAAGQPRAELFQADALHLNGTGYQLWASIIGPHLR
jgi:lysophospholipase L1-like esterase